MDSMHRLFRLKFGILFTVVFLTTAAGHAQTPAATDPPAPTAPASPPIVRHLAQGVDLIQETLHYGRAMGPHILTAIEVDPKAPGVRIVAGLAQNRATGTERAFGREPVSHFTIREKAVAGVNGGFFSFAGFPVDLHIQDGDLVSVPERDCESFYRLNDGTLGFGHFTYSGAAAAAGGAVMPIAGMNQVPTLKNQTLILYTNRFSPQTLKLENRYEVQLSGMFYPIKSGQRYSGMAVATGEGGAMKFRAGTVILSGAGPAAEFLRAAAPAPGAVLSFQLDVKLENGAAATDAVATSTVDLSQIDEAISGRVLIVRSGKATRASRAPGEFATTPHPRTAVGITADGKLLLITVDGRQKGFSEGAPLPDLARAMIGLGAVEALNLDGGGSSEAIVWDNVVNSPSDGSERSVADMLVVYANDLPQPKQQDLKPKLSSPPRALEVGETWDFGTASGLGSEDEAVWGSMGTRQAIGFVSQTGVFRALRPGKGTVSVTLGSRGRRTSVPVVVNGVGGVDSAEFTSTLTLKPDAAAPETQAVLTVKVANADGDPLGNEPFTLTVTGGHIDQIAISTNAKGTAQVNIVWDAAPPTGLMRSIAVTSPQMKFKSSRIDVPAAAKP